MHSSFYKNSHIILLTSLSVNFFIPDLTFIPSLAASQASFV
ncbi:hypothetical protein P7266_0995 [Lactococcus cremoris]|nr:hypothetical protein P7266_0995 [Lactococcus cremoris]